MTLSQHLTAYENQLRTDAEITGATAVVRLGPLWLATFDGGMGFITHGAFEDAEESAIRAWVVEALAHYRRDPAVTRVEWKTRGHDHAPGLHDALVRNGFEPDEPEAIMIGAAAALAVDVQLPPGVHLRKVTEEADIRAMSAMQDEVFGDPASNNNAESLLSRVRKSPDMELWIAEHGDTIVSAGRLEPVAGTDFAGIWGGSTLPQWRGQGIYRALTAARARSALKLGKTLIHSDSTEYSRPILERYGLVRVSTTTPYRWRR
ncbi:GNAT family N-acetyltransferase [Arthrobacter sp. zg-ZUI100]|uniref:GNAT family N-acetyltransferase n=1 Tax=Arthrobacter jiangjiafuii TaxID=2817475 RepID=UPI001AED198B|nr:GNAT family N-acetyltransferase [Arthrobacter jiangjiafuii]MBP3036554.1 GNAT family N-acetyltransferase [Arthrobacter jiangjiafuii]